MEVDPMEWHTEMKDVITNLKPKNTENEGGGV